MKLYATVSSERATKGQGGKYLIINVKDEKKQTLANIVIENEGEKPTIEVNYDRAKVNVDRLMWDGYKEPPAILKGKKQKGELKCENICSEQKMDGSNMCEFHSAG
ncbi:MAG TPA: hypothetical protein ENI23_12500 [bacterium]|nr:hypothetical protein [bacterium]